MKQSLQGNNQSERFKHIDRNDQIVLDNLFCMKATHSIQVENKTCQSKIFTDDSIWCNADAVQLAPSVVTKENQSRMRTTYPERPKTLFVVERLDVQPG